MGGNDVNGNDVDGPEKAGAGQSGADVRTGDDAADCLIVGGGPAGLTAAIYLGRFHRSAIVVDADEGHGVREVGEVAEAQLGRLGGGGRR